MINWNIKIKYHKAKKINSFNKYKITIHFKFNSLQINLFLYLQAFILDFQLYNYLINQLNF